MENIARRACAITAALMLGSASVSYGAIITQIRVYGCTSVGIFSGADLWDTLPGGNFNLGVMQGAAWQNGPTDAQADVNIPITSTTTYQIFGSPGQPEWSDIQIYFDNAPLPQISALQDSFSVGYNASSPQVGFHVNPGLGALTYSDGTHLYTLSAFQWYQPTTLDLVGRFTTGADGTKDYNGSFTLTVSSINETPPSGGSIPEPASLGLLGVGVLAMLRRKRR